MSLESRRENFKQMTNQFECKMLDDLICVSKIDPYHLKKIQTAVCIYLSRSLPGNQWILDGEELIAAYDKYKGEIKNMTPNGMMVPKRNLILEYNQVVKAFAELMDSLNIKDYVSSWHIPLNVRVKYGFADEENLKRHHPTEDIHSDSWAGESAESVTTMVQLFGDFEKNHVKFFTPPDNFEEEWLGPLESYRAGKKYADQYSPVEFIPHAGDLIVSDFSTLHSSSRLPGAGTRITIDTTFALRRIQQNTDSQEVIHPWREEERASYETLLNIGQETLFAFPQTMDQQVDSQGGFKHPSKLEVLDIFKN